MRRSLLGVAAVALLAAPAGAQEATCGYGTKIDFVDNPKDAATFLRESKWVVETAKTCIKESKGDGAKFKEMFRKAHAEKLRTEFGIVVEPVTFDPPGPQDEKDALTYRDPSGRPLAPKL